MIERKKLQREFSAGGVVFKRVKERESRRVEELWLVTKSTPSELYPKSVWRLPKGWIDDGDEGKNPGPVARGERKAREKDLQQTAKKEVKEEGGIEAEVVQKIGSFTYFRTQDNQRILKFVTFYLMKWVKDLKEGFGEETSEVEWLPFDEARKILDYSNEKKILDEAKKILEEGVQESLI